MSVFWRATLNWRNTTEGTNAQNVLYFEDTSEVKTADQIGVIIDDSFWGTGGASGELRNFTSTNVVLQTISLQRIRPLPALGSTPFVTQQRFGVNGSATRHVCLCYIFTFKDGGAGKKHRGRMYHFGHTNSQSDIKGPLAGNVTGTMTQWANNIIARFGPAGTTGLILCLFHRGAAAGSEFTRVTSIQPRPFFGLQRRRNYNVGM